LSDLDTAQPLSGRWQAEADDWRSARFGEANAERWTFAALTTAKVG
jgi:hypothetical protein